MQTILILTDPDGEELAASLGEEVGRTQAASLDQLLNKDLVTFAYEVGKLIGPTIIEIVKGILLSFFGIEVGFLAVAVSLANKAPRLKGRVLDLLTPEFDVTDLPSLQRHNGDHGDAPSGPPVDTEVPGDTVSGPTPETPAAGTPATEVDADVPGTRTEAPLSGADLKASVASSSSKPNSMITPQEAANEVAWVDAHPDVVVTELLTNRHQAKIGDEGKHEIVERPAGGCERWSSDDPLQLDRCPVAFGAQTTTGPAGKALPFKEPSDRELEFEELFAEVAQEQLILYSRRTDITSSTI